MSLSPHEYIHHILDEIDFISTQITDMDYESFVRNPTVKRAFVRSLEIIGEASKKLPEGRRHKTRIQEANVLLMWFGCARDTRRLVEGRCNC